MDRQGSIALGAFALHLPAPGSAPRGSQGRVYPGEHVRTGFPVAIKVLGGSQWRTPAVLRAFHRETTAAARLDHPAIVTLLDLGRISKEASAASGERLHAGSPYVVMEWATRGTVQDLAGDAPWHVVRQVLMRVLDALAHAHARGVFHRDIKPGNVLLGCRRHPTEPLEPGFGGIRVADFGIAWLADAPDHAGGGTRAYMAPEQLSQSWWDYGPWTDLYGLGGLAWTLVTGTPPLPGARFELRIPVPPGFEAWVGTLRHPDPRRRFPFAAHAASALRALDGPSETPTLHARADASDPDAWEDRAPWPTQRLLDAGAALVGLREPPLVGRRHARQALWGALVAAGRDRRTSIAHLAGPPRTGRTRIGRWISTRAHELGVADVLHVAGGDASGRALARALSTRLAAGPRGELALDGVPGWAATALEAWLGEGVLSPTCSAALATLVEAWCVHRPQLVVLDDIGQLGDEARALRAVLQRANLPLLVVTAGADGDAVRALGSSPGAREVSIGPMAWADVDYLIRGALALEGGLAAELATAADGRPGDAVRALRRLARGGRLAPSDAGFVRTAGTPLDLDHGVRDALEVAALLAPPIDADQWAVVCGRDLTATLAEMVVAGRLRLDAQGAWLTDASMAATLRAEAVRSGRAAAHHRRIAEVLGRTDPRWAGHALRGGDVDEAFDAVLAEAQALNARGMPRSALERVAWAEEALDGIAASPDDLRRGRCLALRVRAWTDDGRGSEGRLARARSLRDRSRRHGWAGLEAVAWLTIAMNEQGRGQPAQALAAFTEAERLGRAQEAPGVVLDAVANRGFLRLTQLADPDAARRDFTQLVELGGQAELAGAYGLCALETQSGDAQLALDHGAQAVALARASSNPVWLSRALEGHGNALRRSGDPQGAARLLDEAAAAVRGRGAPIEEARIQYSLGSLALAQGAIDKAQGHFAAALDLGERIGSPLPVTTLGLAMVAVARGERDRVRVLARDAAIPDMVLGRVAWFLVRALAARWAGDGPGSVHWLDLAEQALGTREVVVADLAWLASRLHDHWPDPRVDRLRTRLGAPA